MEFLTVDGLQRLLTAASGAGIMITEVQQKVIDMEEYYQKVFRRAL